MVWHQLLRNPDLIFSRKKRGCYWKSFSGWLGKSCVCQNDLKISQQNIPNLLAINIWAFCFCVQHHSLFQRLKMSVKQINQANLKRMERAFRFLLLGRSNHAWCKNYKIWIWGQRIERCFSSNGKWLNSLRECYLEFLVSLTC